MADNFVNVKLIITNPATGEVKNKDMQIQDGMVIKTSKNDDKKSESIYRISEKTKTINIDAAVAGELEAITGLNGDNKLSKEDAQLLRQSSGKDVSLFMTSAQEKVEQNGSPFKVDNFEKREKSIRIGAKDPTTYDSVNLDVEW